MRTLRIAIAVIATSLVIVADGSAWNSNVFRNPTGNIYCRFLNPGYGLPSGLACDVRSSRLDVQLSANARATTRLLTKNATDFAFQGAAIAPILGYGQTWRTRQFTCLSTYRGMRCWTGFSSHGFFVGSSSVNTY